jgi:hypothetical protein
MFRGAGRKDGVRIRYPKISFFSFNDDAVKTFCGVFRL